MVVKVKKQKKMFFNMKSQITEHRGKAALRNTSKNTANKQLYK